MNNSLCILLRLRQSSSSIWIQTNMIFFVFSLNIPRTLNAELMDCIEYFYYF